MDIACMLVERGADMWKQNDMGENPIQVVAEKTNKKLLYNALTVSMKNREAGFERWKRRKAFVSFLSCYSMQIMLPAAAADRAFEIVNESAMMNSRSQMSYVTVVFKSKDIVRYISKFL
jgi:hypothetical protein